MGSDGVKVTAIAAHLVDCCSSLSGMILVNDFWKTR